MKFDELKKARWTLTIGGNHPEEKVGNWLNGYAYIGYSRGFDFETEVHHKHFRILYSEHNYDGTVATPLCIFDEPVEALEKDVVDWVENEYTTNGFKALYESIFDKLLRNF